jgi:resuscitation-promoting factor RpfB
MRQTLSLIMFFAFLLNLIVAPINAQEQDSNFLALIESREEENKNLFPPKRVRVIYADEEFNLLTYEENIKDVLDAYDFEYSHKDIIAPKPEKKAKNINLVKIILIETKTVKKLSEIPFKTRKVMDDTILLGKEQVSQQGSKGEKETTYIRTFRNGKHYKTEIKSVKVTKKPVEKIIRVGTKKIPLGGRKCNHWYEVVNKKTKNDNERKILKSLIWCESGCNDSAVNSNRYFGLLQFHINTFRQYSGGNIWDGEEQITAALKMIRSGGLSHHWPTCSKYID